MKDKRLCVHCGKECEPWQRNTDDTYLHDDCARAITVENGWTAVVSRPKEDDS